jgi:hypothetical protein
MNKKQAINAITGILKDVFSPGNSEKVSKEKYAYTFQNETSGWKLTTADKLRLDDAARVLHKEYPQVHEKTCRKYIEGFCCDQFPENYDDFHTKLPDLLEKLRLANQNNSDVFVLVAGMHLGMERFKLGPVDFIHSNSPEINELREKVPDINGDYADPLPEKCVVGRYRVDGDSEYSREIAIEQLQLALDILQFASAPVNSGTLKQHILSFGLYLGENKEPASLKTWTYQKKKPSWYAYRGSAKRPNNHFEKFGLQLTESCIEELQEYRLSELEQIFASQDQSYFEENILSAIRWFSKAVRDVQSENKYLDLFIALEGLFSNDVRNPENMRKAAFTHREGVAFMLGKTTDERILLHDRMAELAITRNKIVHSGYSTIDQAELLSLSNYVFLCCLKALELKDQFKEKGSFSKWAKRCKFGEPISIEENEPPSADAQAY